MTRHDLYNQKRITVVGGVDSIEQQQQQHPQLLARSLFVCFFVRLFGFN